jgi:DNA-binding transcriptional LysR family regulator
MSLGGTDLNLMVALHALLEEVNVTRAGDRIGMTQPAMSSALARLRRHYGDELLVRVGRGYELTPLAHALLPDVQRAMPLIESAFQLGERFVAPTSDRRFSVAMSDYALTVLHGPLTRRVAAEAPAVSLDVCSLPAETDLDHLLLEYDFVVALGGELPGNGLPLFRDRFVCAVDAGNPRVADGVLSAADFAASPHAVAELGLDRDLSIQGIARTALVRSYGWLTLPFLIAGTDLVAVLPERLARRICRLPAIEVVPFPLEQAGLTATLWWHPNREHDPAHGWLLALLTEASREIADPDL